MGEVRWTATPKSDAGEWDRGAGPFGPCQSCGKETTLRPDPIAGQNVCRGCWEALMFGDE